MKKKKSTSKKNKKLDEEQEKIERDSNENEQKNEEEGKDTEEEEEVEDKKETKKRRRRYIKKKEEDEDEEKIEEKDEEEEIQIKKIVKKKKNKTKAKPKSKKKNEKAKIEIPSEDTSEENSEASKDNAIFIGKKSKFKKSKIKNQNVNFENNIMDTYKKISLNEGSSYNEENNEEEKNIIYTSQMKLNLKYCEKKLREALNILEKNPNLVINRNILDKLSRLTQHDKINLNYVIGNIYMILMNKESVFDYDDEEFEINDLVLFINKVIQFKEILANTKIGIIYNNYLIKFLIKISNEFDLEEDQINIINKILDENKEMDHKNLLQRNFDDLIYSISDELMKQPNIYEQYKILIQNKKLIIHMFKGADLKDKDLYDRYLEIGKDLAYLFFNKTFRIYITKTKRVSNDDDSENDDNVNDDIFGFTYIFFDGYKSNGELNVVNSEKYLVESDNKIDELRLKILDIILAYCKKFIDLIDEFAIQYIIYILIKRIYFSNFNKYNKTIINLLSEALTNLCFFEDSPIELISYFINRILKSTQKEDENLKNKIIKKINEVKDEEGFLYRFPKSLKHLEEEKKENTTDKKNSIDKKDETKDKNKKIKNKKEKKEDEKEEEKKEDEKEEEKKEEEKKEEQDKDKKKKKKKYTKEKNEEEEEDDEGEEEEDDEEEEEEEEEEIDDKDDDGDKISRANNEGLLLLEKDLKIGFFYVKNIKAGEKFVFYEEITNSYGILDFCMTIHELDIKLTITDLTEGRVIFTKEGIDQLVYCPLKIVMFFSNPRILKFEFDNSYSWFTSKTVKYKTTVLYPRNPYLIGHQILISKYQNIIIKGKKTKDEKDKDNNKKIKRLNLNDNENENKKEDEDGEELNDVENILITKIDGENKVFNCINVKENLNQINKMVKDKYLFISSIYLEISIKKENEENLNKSYFYYNKEGQGLVQNELKQENFEKYLSDLISKSKANLNLINLYIINGDIKENESNNINNTKFYYFSMKKILGFEPVIKISGMMKKIIFFIQYLNQAQMLYYLYKKINNHQKYDITLLINYTKYCGYQFALYYDEEIFVDLNEFKGLSKDKSLEENIEIITKGINKLNEGDNNDDNEEEKLFEIVLPKAVDDNENDITPIKIEEKLKEKLQINENKKIKFKIVKPLLNFNKELQINSHVFYLDN